MVKDDLDNKIKNSKKIKISPSILSLTLNEVPDRLKKIENNIDYIHIDVMDGKFVANCTDGVDMFQVAQKASNKPLDVHLMVENPMEEVLKYNGADIITFHIEAVMNENIENVEAVKNIINKIKSMGAKVGISVKPNTSVSTLINYFDRIDLILVMTVEPGYGGQKLIQGTLSKVKELRDLGFNKLIEVDGGITTENASEVRKEDVDIIVAGTAIFGAEDEKEAIMKIK